MLLSDYRPSRELRGCMEQYARNGRWGTCAHCPRDADQKVYPEMCEYTERYDHLLSDTDLCERIKNEKRRFYDDQRQRWLSSAQ